MPFESFDEAGKQQEETEVTSENEGLIESRKSMPDSRQEIVKVYTAPGQEQQEVLRQEKTRRLEELKNRLSRQGIEEVTNNAERIPATPEDVAQFLEEIGPEYKKLLMKEYKSTQWNNDPNDRKVEYPFICKSSSRILGRIIADICKLDMGGKSPNRVDVVCGNYDGIEHQWTKVTINGKSYYVDATLRQQREYVDSYGQMNKTINSGQKLPGKWTPKDSIDLFAIKMDNIFGSGRGREKTRRKKVMMYLAKIMDDLPDDIIFMPYEEALKKMGVNEDELSDDNRRDLIKQFGIKIDHNLETLANPDKKPDRVEDISAWQEKLGHDNQIRREIDKMISDAVTNNSSDKTRQLIERLKEDKKLMSLIKKFKSRVSKNE